MQDNSEEVRLLKAEIGTLKDEVSFDLTSPLTATCMKPACLVAEDLSHTSVEYVSPVMRRGTQLGVSAFVIIAAPDGAGTAGELDVRMHRSREQEPPAEQPDQREDR
jgi:hypothetical protein